MQEKILKTVECLKNGGIILYPTDTIWGLGCDATNEEAVQKLIDLKGRGADKSFILLADSFRMIEHHIPDFPEVVYDLVDYATRPLTVIYPDAKRLAPSVLAEDNSVGIRLTTDPICCKIIQKLRKPIVSTSANISGMPHPLTFSEVDQKLIDQVDLVFDERTKELLKPPSQIIKIDVDGGVKIIRK